MYFSYFDIIKRKPNWGAVESVVSVTGQPRNGEMEAEKDPPREILVRSKTTSKGAPKQDLYTQQRITRNIQWQYGPDARKRPLLADSPLTAPSS